MKKNAMLKIAAVLLVAVLLTTCAISSTFAKYVSEASSDEASARVAKWGVTTTMTLSDENDFSHTYGTGDKLVSAFGGEGDKVVAPGTSGTLTFSYALSGKSEVSGIVNFNIEVENPADIPLQFSLNGGSTWVDWDSDEITVASKKFAPGQSLSAAEDIDIMWRWLFERGNDGADTALADVDKTNLFTITVSAQAEQYGPAVPEN